MISAASALLLRELKCESRRPRNYWARVGAGALVTAIFALATLPQYWQIAAGRQLFNQISMVTLLLIWFVAPLLTADCLSSEKREGTLGLLFLTPLTPAGIVLGKSLVHGLRASSVVLAGLPVLSLSILFGGVSLMAVLMMLMHFLGALCIALAAGLIASAWTRDWLRSVILTVCFTILLATLYYQAMRFVVFRGSLRSAVGLLGCAGLVLVAAALTAASRIRSTWQEGPPSKFKIWLSKTFCSPILWKEAFLRQSNRRLAANPVGWLYERTATGRATKWLWCCLAVVASASGAESTHNFVFASFEFGLGVAMTFAGASSFRRERQNGVMELLLVSPMETDQILHGRWRALVKQFLPPVAMVILPFVVFALVTGVDLPTLDRFIFPQCFLLASSLAVLPALGLYTSFRVHRFLSAWLLASLIGIALPYYGALLVYPLQNPSVFELMALLQALTGGVAIKFCRTGLVRTTLAQPAA